MRQAINDAFSRKFSRKVSRNEWWRCPPKFRALEPAHESVVDEPQSVGMTARTLALPLPGCAALKMLQQKMKDLSGFGQLFLRIALGIGFIGPVLDRMGMLGPFGTARVSWGDWNHFVSYANSLMPYLNRPGASVMSFIITIVEATIGVCLVLGFHMRIVTVAAALLTLMFGLSMAVFLGVYAPFAYPVFVFTGSALVLSGIPRYKWSIDDLD